MAQEFHVLRCFSCHSFQVQQVKKANKWSCKLCGEKQTLLKEFGRGSGADCRRHAQRLNAMRGAKIEEEEHHTWQLWEKVDGEGTPRVHAQVTQSRWRKYLDTPEEDKRESDREDLMDRQQLSGNNMTDRKRKRGGGDECLQSIRDKNRNSAPVQRNTNPSRSLWAHFLNSDCQVEGAGFAGSGWGQPLGAVNPSCSDIRPSPISQGTTLPVSSMFESEAEFNFDDEFMTSHLLNPDISK